MLLAYFHIRLAMFLRNTLPVRGQLPGTGYTRGGSMPDKCYQSTHWNADGASDHAHTPVTRGLYETDGSRYPDAACTACVYNLSPLF
jgi:hypothetical protein